VSAPVDEEAMRREFERLAAVDAATGGSLAATYGLLLLQRQAETQRQLADLKAKLQDLLVRFIAIGGMHWENLPLLPVLPPQPLPQPQPQPLPQPQPQPPVAPVEP
jgi:hypothetical protein